MGKKRTEGALAALEAMRTVAKEWAEGAWQNEVDGRDVKPAEEQPFVLADILNMINDAAREVGTEPPPPPPPVQSRAAVVEIASAGTVTRSFSIMTGDTVEVTLVGYVEGSPADGLKRITIPCTIRTHLA